MLDDKIEKLREELNLMLEEPYINTDKTLETSKKLDELIVEYYKKMQDKDEDKSIWFYSHIII